MIPTDKPYYLPPLQESQRQQRLQAGLDLLDQGLTVFDADLRLVAWNEPFIHLLDFPRSLLYLGAPFESFIRHNAERGEYGPGDIEEQIALRVQRARAFQSHSFERSRPNGQILAVRGEPLPHRGFVTLYTDITAQRRYEQLIREQNAELEQRVLERTAALQATNTQLTAAMAANSRMTAALQRNEERLRLITDSVPALIGYFDRDQIYRFANRRYADWYGVPRDQIVGCSIISVVGEKIYRFIEPYLQKALRGQKVSYEYAIDTDPQQTRHARSTLVPELDDQGEVLGCFVQSVDITELKNAQAALIQAQKMEAVGQLGGGLAHDFNNLLTVILGNLGSLQEQRGQDQELMALVQPAIKAARQGAELIRRLLTLSRQQPLQPSIVDVNAIIHETIILLGRSLPENIRITTELSGTSCLALTDPNQLENALLNLALNARDAMPNGGLLHFQTRIMPASLRSADHSLPDLIEIVVSDNGSGMNQATLSRAIEPFFTTKPFGAGSGLGLSMVYGFTNQSGGNLQIDSTPEVGTSVILQLPWSAQAAQIAPAVAPQDVPSNESHPLVLLVEDDGEVRALVRRFLIELGYPVLEAENGLEAKAMLATIADIGILISDIVMPGEIDGLALQTFVAQHVTHVRVILMSGYSHQQSAINHAEEHIRLSKPFSKADLAQALSSSLSTTARPIR